MEATISHYMRQQTAAAVSMAVLRFRTVTMQHMRGVASGYKIISLQNIL